MSISKDEAARIFDVSPKHVSNFKRTDPFNHHEVEGWICRKRNKNGGSLVITRVNDWTTKQVIWATPKLAYPYRDGTTELQDFRGDIAGFYLGEKHNGMNILFYKYLDDKGETCITAKSKGTPFVGDSDAGPFLTLLREAMDTTTEWVDSMQDFTEDETATGISYELCGRKEPHLVNYDFDLALKPLFTIHENGRVKPVINTREKTHGYGNLHMTFSSQDDADFKEQMIHKFIGHAKDAAAFANDQYRKRKGLSVRYEYDHFITEGMVLYVLRKDGYVTKRTMYKIKPSDIEEVHWQRFDETMQGRVDEAVAKCKEREYDVTPENVQAELDMGEKEWGKFGRAVTKYMEEKGYVK